MVQKEIKTRRRDYQRRYRAANPERTQFYTRRALRLAAFRRLGLTEESYLQTLIDQGWTCGVCKNFFEDTPALDHDHATGKFRGLLCSECNTALGLFRENPTTLRNAINYLEVHGSQEAVPGSTESVGTSSGGK